MIREVDHIAIAVRRIEERLEFWKRLGLRPGGEHRVDTEGVRVRFLSVGNNRLELVEPITPDSPVGRFLDRRGEGIHHICFQVDSVRETSRTLDQAGIPLVGGIRTGARGTPITFVHPRSAGGVLVELVEGGSGSRSG